MEGDANGGKRKDPFHLAHKVTAGESPYNRAKQLQLVEKDRDASIVWFWKAINAGDRVDSALKDMALVMKQQDRTEEAVEAIKSFRHLCSPQSQESIDNILIDLYKRCRMVKEQIVLIKQKLWKIYIGEAFNGRATKRARSHGKKFQVTIKQESSRLLGNLGWAYMQQGNCLAAEAVYRKAQIIDPDANKACNLGLCLMKQGRFEEARQVLDDVTSGSLAGSYDRSTMKWAEELMREIEVETQMQALLSDSDSDMDMGLSLEEELIESLDFAVDEWEPFRPTRLPVFQELSSPRDEMAC